VLTSAALHLFESLDVGWLLDLPSRLPWAELLARVFLADVFACPKCSSGRLQRIAWITDSDTIHRILRAVGLPTDSPRFHPARHADEPLPN